MSVKCEQPIDELTVQVWLLYDHPNFKYCTLFVSGMDLQTNGQTDKQTIQTLDAPGGPFRKMLLSCKIPSPEIATYDMVTGGVSASDGRI